MFYDDSFFQQADSAFEFHSDDWSHGDTFSPWAEPIGEFYGSGTEHMSQTTGFTCAVVSQQMILKDFGVDVSEAQLVYDATSNGWLTNTGTSIDDMGRLLEHNGISTHTNHSGDLSSLVNELAHGHKVIVSVNSGELWEGVSFWQRLTGSHNTGADHAIVVSGVDFSDPDNPMVVVNDPGSGAGGTQAYPLEHFLESWNDSNCTYLATDEAPAGLALDAQLGNSFNDNTGMYLTEEYWTALAVAVAVAAASVLLHDMLTDTFAADNSSFAYASPWESFDSVERNELFMNI